MCHPRPTPRRAGCACPYPADLPQGTMDCSIGPHGATAPCFSHGSALGQCPLGHSQCWSMRPQGAGHCSQPGLLQPVNKQETLSPCAGARLTMPWCTGLLPALRSHHHPSFSTRGSLSCSPPGGEQGRELLRQLFPAMAMQQDAFTKWKERKARHQGAGGRPGPPLPAGPSSSPAHREPGKAGGPGPLGLSSHSLAGYQPARCIAPSAFPYMR